MLEWLKLALLAGIYALLFMISSHLSDISDKLQSINETTLEQYLLDAASAEKRNSAGASS